MNSPITPSTWGSALVTGGASGLGAATVLRLAQEGYHVLAVDRDSEAGERLKAATDGAVAFTTCDVTDEAEVESAVREATDLTPHGLRLVVHCAGIGPIERLVGRRGPHRTSTWQQVIDVNVTGTFNVLRAASTSMAQNELDAEGDRGAVVLTASAAAFEGKLGHVAYAASKAAVVGMTLPAARDLSEHAIRVCSIAPGIFESPLMEGLPPAARAGLLDDAVHPMRLGRPEEFADLVAAVARNRMLNGETIRLDGAIRLTSGLNVARNGA